MSENTNVNETVESTGRGFGYANMTPEQKAEALAKQKASMEDKWKDPVYKARVAKGRHAKSVEKLNGEIAAIDAKLAGPEVLSEDDAKALNASKEKLVAKRDASQVKVDEADKVIAEATPVVDQAVAQ